MLLLPPVYTTAPPADSILPPVLEYLYPLLPSPPAPLAAREKGLGEAGTNALPRP